MNNNHNNRKVEVAVVVEGLRKKVCCINTAEIFKFHRIVWNTRQYELFYIQVKRIIVQG